MVAAKAGWGGERGTSVEGCILGRRSGFVEGVFCSLERRRFGDCGCREGLSDGDDCIAGNDNGE